MRHGPLFPWCLDSVAITLDPSWMRLKSFDILAKLQVYNHKNLLVGIRIGSEVNDIFLV
jgi:hypothetical protein